MENYIGSEWFGIFDSEVNHINLSDKEIETFTFKTDRKKLLSSCKYPFYSMDIGDIMEYKKQSAKFQHSIRNAAREWIIRNKLSWEIRSIRSGNDVLVIRTK